MRAFWTWSQLLLLTVVLGCSSQEGVAQEKKPAKPTTPAPEKPADSPAPKEDAPKAKEKEETDSRTYTATVKDKHLKKGEKPFVIKNAVPFVPEVTLFGGGGGEEVKTIELKRGSALIKIPFSRVERLIVGKHKEDRLDLTVKLRGVEKPLVGTVKSSLELRGKLGAADLATVVKMREAKSIDLAPDAGK